MLQRYAFPVPAPNELLSCCHLLNTPTNPWCVTLSSDEAQRQFDRILSNVRYSCSTERHLIQISFSEGILTPRNCRKISSTPISISLSHPVELKPGLQDTRHYELPVHIYVWDLNV